MKPEEKNSLKQELLHSIFSYRQQQINNYQQKYTKQDIMVCLSHLKSKKPEDQSFFDQTISAAKQLTLPSIEKYFVRQLQNRMITVDNFSVQYELIAKELAQKLCPFDDLIYIEKMLTIELLKEKIEKKLKFSSADTKKFSTYDWQHQDTDFDSFYQAAQTAYPQFNWDDLLSSTTLEVKTKLYKIMNPPDYHYKNELFNLMLYQVTTEHLQFSMRNGRITTSVISKFKAPPLPSVSQLTKKSKAASALDNEKKEPLSKQTSFPTKD